MDRIELSAEDRGMLGLRMARIDAYKHLAQIEEMDLKRIIYKIYKLDPSENWALDLEKGTLERVSNEQG